MSFNPPPGYKGRKECLFDVSFPIIVIMRKDRNSNEMLFYIQTMSKDVNKSVIWSRKSGNRTGVLDMSCYKDNVLRMKSF